MPWSDSLAGIFPCALAVLTAGACAAEPAPPRPPSAAPSPSLASAPRDTVAPGPDEEGACGCLVDADCVKITPGCCGCRNGGEERAVAEGCLPQIQACQQPEAVRCEGPYRCTDREPRCRAGSCELR